MDFSERLRVMALPITVHWDLPKFRKWWQKHTLIVSSWKTHFLVEKRKRRTNSLSCVRLDVCSVAVFCHLSSVISFLLLVDKNVLLLQRKGQYVCQSHVVYPKSYPQPTPWRSLSNVNEKKRQVYWNNSSCSIYSCPVLRIHVHCYPWADILCIVSTSSMKEKRW